MSTTISSSREEILIVDDTPANLRLLSQMLVGKGYRVRTVTNGAWALESVRTAPPQLILLDIRMPEMNGYEVCEILKSDANTRDIPVIFISALDDLVDKVRAFRSGGVDYITKPFQLEEVLVRTETHLALRRMQKELQDANRRYERELNLAGQIQASFLSQILPNIPGWELSAILKPARQTSGDFYDVITLPDGCIGILIADVVDKGAGAALYMALCLSLLRTYSVRYPLQPSKVFEEVNRRLVVETGASQFVTVFYGVLDPMNGKLVFCNAGQCPPIHVSKQDRQTQDNNLPSATSRERLLELTQNGPPLGIFDGQTWKQQTVHLNPGDILVLYTDGITEAENSEGNLFGTEGLCACTREQLNEPAPLLQERILNARMEFAANSVLDDDIALVILKRQGG
jgi:phosphoserine phosphatase RsbU/P